MKCRWKDCFNPVEYHIRGWLIIGHIYYCRMHTWQLCNGLIDMGWTFPLLIDDVTEIDE